MSTAHELNFDDDPLPCEDFPVDGGCPMMGKWNEVEYKPCPKCGWLIYYNENKE